MLKEIVQTITGKQSAQDAVTIVESMDETEAQAMAAALAIRLGQAEPTTEEVVVEPTEPVQEPVPEPGEVVGVSKIDGAEIKQPEKPTAALDAPSNGVPSSMSNEDFTSLSPDAVWQMMNDGSANDIVRQINAAAAGRGVGV